MGWAGSLFSWGFGGSMLESPYVSMTPQKKGGQNPFICQRVMETPGLLGGFCCHGAFRKEHLEAPPQQAHFPPYPVGGLC